MSNALDNQNWSSNACSIFRSHRKVKGQFSRPMMFDCGKIFVGCFHESLFEDFWSSHIVQEDHSSMCSSLFELWIDVGMFYSKPQKRYKYDTIWNANIV